MLGRALAPFPGTSDFSAFLVQAKASGAKVIGLANGGGDTVNCIKQAAEFGIMKGGQSVAGLIVLIQDVHGVGLEAAQGVLLTEPYYWNLNAATREFGLRYAARLNGAVPNSVQAGQYAAVMHYLKAAATLGVEHTKTSGRAAVGQMKAMPTDDPIFGKGRVRQDGRVIHDMHLFEVKSPAESKEPWDYYMHKRHHPRRAGVPPDGPGRLQAHERLKHGTRRLAWNLSSRSDRSSRCCRRCADKRH